MDRNQATRHPLQHHINQALDQLYAINAAIAGLELAAEEAGATQAAAQLAEARERNSALTDRVLWLSARQPRPQLPAYRIDAYPDGTARHPALVALSLQLAAKRAARSQARADA